MSWEMMQTWAKEAPVATAPERAVLQGLVTFADNSTYTCWPSITTLSRQTVLSRRTVERALTRLEAAGLISREYRYREDGSQTANLYRLHVDFRVAVEGAARTRELFEADLPAPPHADTTARQNAAPGAAERRPGGGTAPHQLTSHRTTQEELVLIPPPPSPEQPLDSFAAWYARYPRKVGRAAAEKAYRRALKTTTPEALTAGLDRMLAEIAGKKTSPEYIKHPATWLNGACWDDEYVEVGFEEVEFPPWSPPPPDDPSIMDDPAAYSAYVTRERERFKQEYLAQRRQRAADGPADVPATADRRGR